MISELSQFLALYLAALDLAVVVVGTMGRDVTRFQDSPRDFQTLYILYQNILDPRKTCPVTSQRPRSFYILFLF